MEEHISPPPAERETSGEKEKRMDRLFRGILTDEELHQQLTRETPHQGIELTRARDEGTGMEYVMKIKVAQENTEPTTEEDKEKKLRDQLTQTLIESAGNQYPPRVIEGLANALCATITRDFYHADLGPKEDDYRLKTPLENAQINAQTILDHTLQNVPHIDDLKTKVRDLIDFHHRPESHLQITIEAQASGHKRSESSYALHTLNNHEVGKIPNYLVDEDNRAIVEDVPPPETPTIDEAFAMVKSGVLLRNFYLHGRPDDEQIRSDVQRKIQAGEWDPKEPRAPFASKDTAAFMKYLLFQGMTIACISV